MGQGDNRSVWQPHKLPMSRATALETVAFKYNFHRSNLHMQKHYSIRGCGGLQDSLQRLALWLSTWDHAHRGLAEE